MVKVPPFMGVLPELPVIRLEPLEELDAHEKRGFLWIRRFRLLADHRPEEGTPWRSEAFVYDSVSRRDLDAAVMAAHFLKDGRRHVYLRSAVRPPLAVRALFLAHGGLWELPAGLIEAQEEGEEGRRACAKRELMEELGFDVGIDALRELGPAVYPTPGTFAERYFPFEVEVRPEERGEPSLDGSALEAGGVVIAMPCADALAACAAGLLPDAKTELFLRRLAERYPD